jgi:hypothetical protein
MTAPKRPLINMVRLANGRCGLTTDSREKVMLEQGSANVRSVMPATAADVQWVRLMGGEVPEGRLAPEYERNA